MARISKKISDKVIIEALQESGGIITKAAKLLKCSRSFLSAKVNASEELKEARLQAMETIVDEALKTLMKKIKDPDLKANNNNLIIYVLKTLGRNLGFAETQNIKIDGTEQPILIIQPPKK